MGKNQGSCVCSEKKGLVGVEAFSWQRRHECIESRGHCEVLVLGEYTIREKPKGFWKRKRLCFFTTISLLSIVILKTSATQFIFTQEFYLLGSWARYQKRKSFRQINLHNSQIQITKGKKINTFRQKF